MAGVIQQLATQVAAWWLRGKFGGALLEATGATLDLAAQRAREAMQLAQPLLCDASALPLLATERDMILFGTEPLASQRYRLSRWLQIHRYRGTHFGEMANIQPFFLGTDGNGVLPTIRIVHQPGDGLSATWHTLSPLNGAAGLAGISPLPPGAGGPYAIFRATPSNWNWDGQTSKWSRFWVIIHLPRGYTITSGGFNYDGATTWDSGAIWDGITTAALADLYAAIVEAKAAHSHFAGLIVTALQPTDSIPGAFGLHPFDPTSSPTTVDAPTTTLPTGNWGSPIYTSGPNLGLPSRPQWALFYNINNG